MLLHWCGGEEESVIFIICWCENACECWGRNIIKGHLYFWCIGNVFIESCALKDMHTGLSMYSDIVSIHERGWCNWPNSLLSAWISAKYLKRCLKEFFVVKNSSGNRTEKFLESRKVTWLISTHKESAISVTTGQRGENNSGKVIWQTPRYGATECNGSWEICAKK